MRSRSAPRRERHTSRACGALGLCVFALSVSGCDSLLGVSDLEFVEAGADGRTAISLPDAGKDVTTSQDGGSPPPFGPGDGGLCTGPVGGFPSATCDPSDEMAQGCQGAVGTSCTIAPQCGDPNTCEPFVTNPAPGAGVENFRMRLINITAPPSLTNTVIQSSLITAAVDLPADAGSCGENGTGLFNWILSVDENGGTVKTGAAPPSTDPFAIGYCFLNGTVDGTAISPITLQATFAANSFSSAPSLAVLRMPIFTAALASGSAGFGPAVILPIHDLALNDVTVSNDGNCIGAVNNNSISPSADGPCTDPQPTGPASCSRWHSAGSFAGYISLAEADDVLIDPLGESLCVLLAGTTYGNGASPATCTPAGLEAGDYCSTTSSAGGCGDSSWISGQFAASAVAITSGTGVSLCNGGSVDGG